MVKHCPDCGQPLHRINDTLFLCSTTGLYYPSHRGKLGSPLAEPPASMMQPKQPQKPTAPAPDLKRAPITDKEMFSHPKFLEFCAYQYSELPPTEVIHQIRNADPETKRIVRMDFFNWLQS